MHLITEYKKLRLQKQTEPEFNIRIFAVQVSLYI